MTDTYSKCPKCGAGIKRVHDGDTTFECNTAVDKGGSIVQDGHACAIRQLAHAMIDNAKLQAEKTDLLEACRRLWAHGQYTAYDRQQDSELKMACDLVDRAAPDRKWGW